MKNLQKGFAIPIIIAIVALLAASGGVYIYINNKVEVPNVGCTMDAKMCPDGSYVGRTGPDCEFVCPVVASILTQALAEQLVAKKWSDCSSGDCASVEINFTLDRGNQYLISAIFTEYDDSVSKTKREGIVLFSNGSFVWTDYQPSPNEWRICHPGRGSQIFSTDKCF